jgi:hypothetical protein
MSIFDSIFDKSNHPPVITSISTNELGMHHATFNIPVEIIMNENGLVMDMLEEQDSYTMRIVNQDLYYLEYNAMNTFQERALFDSSHPLFINDTLAYIVLNEQIYRSVDYLSNLYRLINGDGMNLQRYLRNLYGVQVSYDEDTGSYESQMFSIDAETHRLWSAFVYDYFGRDREYSEIPKLSEQKLLGARFTLKVNDNKIYRDKAIFNELLFGRQLERFTLSDFLVGTSEGVRYHQDIELYTADKLRYMLQESEVLFANQDTRDVFYNIWSEIMERDISGLSDLFDQSMIIYLSQNFIPPLTVYDPASKNKWQFRGEDEINLAEIWQRGDLAKFEYQPDNGFLHYKLTWKSDEDKYFEVLVDMLKWFTSNISRSVQKMWMKFKEWAHWMYRVLERY